MEQLDIHQWLELKSEYKWSFENEEDDNPDWWYYYLAEDLDIPILLDQDPYLVAQEWIDRGYTPLTPHKEAQVLWDNFKEHYGPRLEVFAEGLTDSWGPRAGYIYVLQSGPFFKIGRTKDVLRRFPQIRIGLPFETRLRLIFYVSDSYEEEQAMHAFYDSYRTHGEWFLLPENVYRGLEENQPSTFMMYATYLMEAQWRARN